MKRQSKTITLIENLAISVKRGFDEVNKKMDERFSAVDQRFDKLEERFDKLELLVNGHENRICNLEDSTRVVKTKLAIK